MPHGYEFGFTSARFANAALSGVLTKCSSSSFSSASHTFLQLCFSHNHQPPEYMDICKLCFINKFFFWYFPPKHLEYVEYVMDLVNLNLKQKEVLSLLHYCLISARSKDKDKHIRQSNVLRLILCQ